MAMRKATSDEYWRASAETRARSGGEINVVIAFLALAKEMGGWAKFGRMAAHHHR